MPLVRLGPAAFLSARAHNLSEAAHCPAHAFGFSEGGGEFLVRNRFQRGMRSEVVG